MSSSCLPLLIPLLLAGLHPPGRATGWCGALVGRVHRSAAPSSWRRLRHEPHCCDTSRVDTPTPPEQPPEALEARAEAAGAAHRAGFVSIIGMPNVGKSTLMNTLVGERLSIITPKAGTTRHRILGILNGEDFQLVYSDTPGIYTIPQYKLQEGMMAAVRGSLNDADLVLLVVDVFQEGWDDEAILRQVEAQACPLLVLLNKVDLVRDGSPLPAETLARLGTEEEMLERWCAAAPPARCRLAPVVCWLPARPCYASWPGRRPRQQ